MKTISTNQKIILSLLALVLLILAYSNHFNNPFEFDDEHTISNNLAIRKLSNIPTFFKDATTTSTLPKSQAYRPGLTTLNAIDFAIGGKETPDPFYFHLSIFLSIIVLGICIFFFSKQLLQAHLNAKHTFLAALITATLFCVHTANSQTINYIISRDDSFSTLMVVLGFVLYLYFPLAKKYYLYLLPVILGFLVKEPAIMFAPLLMVYQLVFENKTSETKHPFHFSNLIVAFKTSFVAFAVLLGLFAFSQYMTPKTWTSGNLDRWEYLMSQPYVFIHYFNNFFLPFNLVIDTDWDFVKSITDDRFIIGFAFVIALVIIIFKTAKKHPIIAFGLAWFLLSLLPSSSIIPLAEVLNDHRPFFGYIGLSLVSVYCLAYLYNRYKDKYPLRVSYMTLTPVILILHSIGTYQQNKIWNSGEGVWKEATIKSPKNGRAWMNYGNALMARGAYTEAQVAFDKALDVWPYYPYIFINRAVLRSVTNQDAEAEQDFKKALQLDNENPETYVCYGRFLLKRNRYEEALALLTQGYNKSVKHAELNSLKAEASLHVTNPQEFTQLKINEALEHVKQNTTHETYLELSLAYYNASQFEACIKACMESLKLKSDYALAYNNMCSAYNQLKQWDKAIDAGNKGLQIEPQNELIKGNLKIALAGKENK